MAIPAEFQEREYESLFIQEISKLGGFTWSPGQTDENFLGFDGGIWLNSSILSQFGFHDSLETRKHLGHLMAKFGFWPFSRPTFWEGKQLHRQFIEDWERFADKLFPKKALNLFVQHKRPHQTTEQGAAGEHRKQAYFEFKIDKNQQLRLEQLERQLGASGVVTYSCAAFLTKTDLWAYEKTQKIIEKTNFVGPSKLIGHSKYTFIEPGHIGHANVDPTPIEGDPFIERLLAASEASEGFISGHIQRAGAAVSIIMEEESPNQTGLYFDIVRRIRERLGIEETESNILKNIIRVAAFNTVNSTSWAIVIPPKFDARGKQ